MQQHGFTLVQETQVAELSSIARLWQHTATGAQVLSFTNNDENKVFGVSFRTPPADSTGVAHILEHSVLCGSAKYPVKEPFVELLKGSLQTFLNAFTYPDKTCYPVASCNVADFRNLTDVYLDAVFFPRITEQIFQQEGWHLEAENETDPITIKGVVYNEMKGAFSSPESVLGRHCLHALFPDTVYGLESGGDPVVIPNLTYNDFVQFHADYYHPSNGRFFFWGDDNENERLEQLGAVLSKFTKRTVNSAIEPQQFLPQPRAVEVPFAASDDDKGMVVVNWLGPLVTDVELGLAFRMLEHILLGMPASPLRRALIESGLGEDVAGQGLETELLQLTFDIGLKGVAPQDYKKVEELILTTLRNLANSVIPSETIEAAVNTIEFALRENNSGRFPVGLSVMLRALTTWMHDADPLAPLQFEAPLAHLKNKIATQKGYFESLIDQWFIANKHRVTVTLTPDTTLGAQQEQDEKDLVTRLTQNLTSQEKAAIVNNTKLLTTWQETPDSAEDLATIPRVGVEDLPATNAIIPSETLTGAPSSFFHPQPTGGIVYADACFSLHTVPEHLLPLLPLFGRALLEMGTREHDFVELNMAIARKTGGMDADSNFLTNLVTRQPVALLSLSGKAAPDKVEDLFALMTEVLTQCSFDDKSRFLSMVLEEKARQEHSLVPAGHMAVSSRLRGNLSTTGWLSEQTDGIPSIFYLRELAKQVETDWKGVLTNLKQLQRLIFTRQGLCCNITALPEQKVVLEQLVAQLTEALPVAKTTAAALWQPKFVTTPEGLVLPAQVNYVGKGINLFEHGYEWHGSALVILKYLRTGYLWEKVRVQGGAYGCMCSLDRMTGAFTMVSYRDPNVMPTLGVYDNAGAFLAKTPLTKSQLDAAIVGAIGELDTYLLPDAKGSAAFTRHLCSDTAQTRQKIRDEVLGTTAQHVMQFGEALHSLATHGLICALGGNAVEAAAKEQNWTIHKVL